MTRHDVQQHPVQACRQGLTRTNCPAAMKVARFTFLFFLEGSAELTLARVPAALTPAAPCMAAARTAADSTAATPAAFRAGIANLGSPRAQGLGFRA